uniref:Uncharacterized protein n=1 Tax=Scleropages formosus TaxID=113540 RepID=A0A8C9VMV5_SCLFO
MSRGWSNGGSRVGVTSETLSPPGVHSESESAGGPEPGGRKKEQQIEPWSTLQMFRQKLLFYTLYN